MASSRCVVFWLAVVAALTAAPCVVGQPMACRLEQSPEGRFEGTCATGEETMALRLSPPETDRRPRRDDALAAGVWSGAMAQGDDTSPDEPLP